MVAFNPRATQSCTTFFVGKTVKKVLEDKGKKSSPKKAFRIVKADFFFCIFGPTPSGGYWLHIVNIAPPTCCLALSVSLYIVICTTFQILHVSLNMGLSSVIADTLFPLQLVVSSSYMPVFVYKALASKPVYVSRRRSSSITAAFSSLKSVCLFQLFSISVFIFFKIPTTFKKITSTSFTISAS